MAGRLDGLKGQDCNLRPSLSMFSKPLFHGIRTAAQQDGRGESEWPRSAEQSAEAKLLGKEGAWVRRDPGCGGWCCDANGDNGVISSMASVFRGSRGPG